MTPGQAPVRMDGMTFIQLIMVMMRPLPRLPIEAVDLIGRIEPIEDEQ